MEVSSIFIGIDVSKARLDVAVHPSGESESAANDKTGGLYMRNWLFARATKPGH